MATRSVRVIFRTPSPRGKAASCEVLRVGWSESGPLEPWRFRLRLQRAQLVRRAYTFQRLAETEKWLAFRISGGQEPYFVFLDLTPLGEHYCTCPDGSYRVQAQSIAGSLCKHVLGCLFREGREGQLLALLCGLSRTEPGSGPSAFVFRSPQ